MGEVRKMESPCLGAYLPMFLSLCTIFGQVIDSEVVETTFDFMCMLMGFFPLGGSRYVNERTDLEGFGVGEG